MPRKKKQKSGMFLCIIKGTVAALIFTMAALLIFALIVKSTDAGDGSIITVNQVIKVIGCVLAALIGARASDSKIVVCGALSSVVYIIAGFLIFSVINKAVGDIVLMLTDCLMALIIGALCGVIAAKIFKKDYKQPKKA